ncbi:hypothetical protein BVX98_03395, partial [bacterium F11]
MREFNGEPTFVEFDRKREYDLLVAGSNSVMKYQLPQRTQGKTKATVVLRHSNMNASFSSLTVSKEDHLGVGKQNGSLITLKRDGNNYITEQVIPPPEDGSNTIISVGLHPKSNRLAFIRLGNQAQEIQFEENNSEPSSTIAGLWEGGDKNYSYLERKEIIQNKAPFESKWLTQLMGGWSMFVVALVLISTKGSIWLDISLGDGISLIVLTAEILGLGWGLAHLGGTYEAKPDLIRYVHWRESLFSAKWWFFYLKEGQRQALWLMVVGSFPFLFPLFLEHASLSNIN